MLDTDCLEKFARVRFIDSLKKVIENKRKHTSCHNSAVHTQEFENNEKIETKTSSLNYKYITMCGSGKNLKSVINSESVK